MNLESLL